jgi:excisionase family DNA binding protein
MHESANTAQDAETLLVSPREAMRVLGVSNSTLYILMRSGELDSINIRRARRIPRTAIRDYIARQLAANPANRRRPGRPRNNPLPRPAAVTEPLEVEA